MATKTIEQPNYIKPSDAARIASVTGDTVRRWIRAGKLPAQRTSTGTLRISEHALKQFLNTVAESKRWDEEN